MNKSSVKNYSVKNSSITNFFTPINIILFLICFIILYIIIKIIGIKNSYSPVFTWWNGNGGNNYSKKLNIFAVMASYDSYIIYLFSSLFGTLSNQIDRTQIDFLVNRIFPYTVTEGIEKITQFVLPRHMTESVLFQRGDNDKWFNSWLDNNGYDSQSSLNYDFAKTPPQKIPDPNTNKIGVYPSSENTQAWKQLIKEWGAKTWIASGDKSGFEVPSLPPEEVAIWLKYEDRPDNFLSRYGILPDCPLVVTFINNYNQDPLTGLKLNPQAFKDLIGAQQNIGGWIGYLNGSKSGDMSSDDYFNYLQTHYATQVIIPPGQAKPCSGGEKTTNWIAGITSGIGAAIVPFFLAGPEGLLTVPIAGILGLILGGATAYTNIDSANNKCKGT